MNRVVVTGMGTVNPLGNNVDEFYENMKNGVNGISELTKVSYDGCGTNFAGEIKELNYEGILTKKELKRMDMFTAYALVAADEAMKDSKINVDEIDKDMFGVCVGVGMGGFKNIEEQIERGITKGHSKVSPLYIPTVIGNLAAGNIAIKYGANGSCLNIVTACASANSCIGNAYRDIKHGYSKVVIAGGTEAGITNSVVAGFDNLTALSHATELDRACIPFDKERDGFIIGEGAGILILEDYEHAKARGAKIYAEIVGYGSTCDANHITSPLISGELASRAMEKALNEGNVALTDVTYINAHGTGTKYNDVSETNAIKHLFKEQAYNINISSTKSMTGHLLGGAGGIEAIATVKALENDIVFPTINLKVKDEECDLNYTPNVSVNVKMKYALSNSLGFGGHNEVICFKKYEV